MNTAFLDDVRTEFNPLEIKEIHAPASPHMLFRAHQIRESGLFRLSRRDCEFYSIQIQAGGGWGRIAVYDGNGLLKFYQPSTFTGSFKPEAGCEGGLIIYAYGAEVPAFITMIWRECED